MSKQSPQRAEGCGQWLSTKNERTTKLTLRTGGGKGKKIKHKTLLNFATSIKRNGGRDIQVSCSPLSPRTKKKLKNAKQSKINKYFAPEVLRNDSKCDKNVGFFSKKDSLLEGKQARISVKRLRHHEDPSFCDKIHVGNSAETEHKHEPICSQNKDSTDQTDCDISGISLLGDSFEEFDDPIEADSPEGCVTHPNSRVPSNYCTYSPPHKKLRTSKSGENLSESTATERISLSSNIDSELSDSFHFTQWRKAQIAKCKEIQDECCFGESSCTDANVVREPGLTLEHSNEETELSETPPFQFTQWAKQQVDICRKIQGQANDMRFTELYHSPELKSLQSREGSLEEKIKDDSESQLSLSSRWDKFCIKTTSNIHSEIHEEPRSSESDIILCDGWIENENFITQSIDSPESEFQFSDWVKRQIHKCQVIQQESKVELRSKSGFE